MPRGPVPRVSCCGASSFARAASLAGRAEAKGLEHAADISAALPQAVIGDALRLRAALENLIDNAVKFTEHGSVRLDVT